MKYRTTLASFILLASVLVTSEAIFASGNGSNMMARVRTVPKETKDQKEKKKIEQRAVTVKELTTSTASLITPKNLSEMQQARTCSQNCCDPAEKILAHNLAR